MATGKAEIDVYVSSFGALPIPPERKDRQLDAKSIFRFGLLPRRMAYFRGGFGMGIAKSILNGASTVV